MIKKINLNSDVSDSNIVSNVAEKDPVAKRKKDYFLAFLIGCLPGLLAMRLFKRKTAYITAIIFALAHLLFVTAGLVTYLRIKPIIAAGMQTKQTVNDTFYLVKTQDLIGAEAKMKDLGAQLTDVKEKYQTISYLNYVPFASWYYQDGQRALDSAWYGYEAADILIKTITPYADVLGFKGQGSFVGGTAEDRIGKIVQTLDKVTPQLDEVVLRIEKIEENISQINPGHYPKTVKGFPIREQIENGKVVLSDAKTQLIEIKPVIEVLPQILGYPDKKKYLMLFQNDGELRPTGGFITAYSIFDMETGKARASNSNDIYHLDSQFGNKVKAPDILKEYLNAQAYHLRDMNFSPDFRVSMEGFLENYRTIKGTEEVDGVIAIDTNVLTRLIDVLGPVEVPGFGTFSNEIDPRCNIEQIICELEYIVDEPLPEIVQNRKSTILGPMMQEIMFKAYGSPKQQWPALYQAIIDSLKQKHMLLYFTEDKSQKAAEAFGAGGRIKETDGDYLAIIDANLGGAKSNLYVESSVEQKYEKTDSDLIKEVTITYVHPEPMDNCNLERAGGLCLSGILQDYFRVYVPEGSELIEGLGSETEIKSSNELGKTVFSGFFKLRGGGGRAKVVLKYKLPPAISAKEDLSLYLQKQPGVEMTKHQIITTDSLQEIDLKKDQSLKINF